MKLNCSVVSRVKTAEIACMLGKQPVVMSVASESGRPQFVSFCKENTPEGLPQSQQREVLRLWHSIAKKQKDKYDGILDIPYEITC